MGFNRESLKGCKVDKNTAKQDKTEFALLEAMEEMEIIDGHEHTSPEEARTSSDVDIFTLFSHYTHRDLARAGMKEEVFLSLSDSGIPLEKRWEYFAPYWENIRHTSYSRAVLIALERFYGEEDLNEGNYHALSEKIKGFNKPGIYRKVFKEACRIKTCLCQCGRTDLDPDIFTPVMPLIAGVGEITPDELTGKSIFMKPLRNIEIAGNPGIKTLDDYISAVERYIAAVKREGAAGLKMKSLPYVQPERRAALDEFRNIKKGRETSVMAFDSYVLDRALDFAGKEGMAVCVHTGYWGDFRRLHPLNMIPLVQSHPGVRFDIYHLGYPWVRETLMLGKGFSNVWLNLCWTHIISRKCAAQALDEAVDLIPSNRIIGFGGDYDRPVEKVYGHLAMAKENIAFVLGKRIKESSMTEKQALRLIKKWLYDNAAELYNIA